MNSTEFKQWWQTHGAVFPETAAWVNGLGPEGKQTILGAWAGALRDTDVRDAHEATRRMLAGDDDSLEAYEREKTPAHIRRIAWRLKSGRSENTEPARLDPATLRKGKPFPISSLLADLFDANDRKASPSDKQAIIDRFAAEHCMPQADYDGPRFYCGTCQDSGMVLCWDHRAMSAMRDGGLDAVRALNNPTCGMLCTCRRGERSKDGPMKGFCRYNVSEHILCLRGDYNSESSLLAFEREYDAVTKARYSSKRTNEFDEYNQREFAR